MGLIDLFLNRRASHRAEWRRPGVEVLEARECPSLAAPTWQQVTVLSSTQVKLAWNDVAGELGYRVLRWDGTKAVQLAQLGQDVRTFTATNLQPDQTHWFAIDAFDSTSFAHGAWMSVRTPPSVLAAPANLQAIGITPTQLTLQWNLTTGAAGYRVYGWTGTSEVLLGTVSAAVNSFTVANLSAGRTYFFYVQAYNASGTASTNWISANTSTTPLGPPTNLIATTLNSSAIGLSWTDTTGETGYRVYRADAAHNSSVLIATLGANLTSYQATGLSPGTTYSFYLQAYNAVSSATSLWAQATTAAAARLLPPTGLIAQVVGAGSVSLTWVEPPRAAGYRVHVWTGAWTLAATIQAGTHQATIGGLATNRYQWFMVQAFTTNFAEIANSNLVFAIL